jgi:hypothetical protein
MPYSFKRDTMKNYFIMLLGSAVCCCANAQDLDAFFLQYHGAGCDNQSGILVAEASGGTGSYTYLWSNGSTSDSAHHLGAGEHTVTIWSGNDSLTMIQIIEPFGIESVGVQHACNGETGSIFLDNINADFPLQFDWYHDGVLMSPGDDYRENLSAGTYSYVMTDGQGCSDSGTAVVYASSPQVDVFLGDSSLCWGQTTQIWYSPGFTIIAPGGQEYNSSTDSVLYMNASGWNPPMQAVDAYGCSAELITPFVYRQPHPDALTVYQVSDTLSLSPAVNLSPGTGGMTYTWYLNSQWLANTGAYTFLEIAGPGNYSVTATNEYGCTRSGSIAVSFAALEETDEALLTIYPNPVMAGEALQIEWLGTGQQVPYRISDSNGKVIATGYTGGTAVFAKAPLNPGMYFLELAGRTRKLIVSE